ncbi:MAG: MBL fold metallo-hydrolase [Clostridiales bacterium]|nr:MBL fold metallo-hydrolase [Clostridiales bacterium]
MDVITFPYGPLGSNMYAVKSGDHAIIIDPSVSPEFPLVRSKLMNAGIDALILTHAHYDHYACLDEWISLTGAKAYLADEDKEFLNDSSLNCSRGFGESMKIESETSDLGESLDVSGFSSMKIIRTPGHTPGSVCILFEEDKVMFTGDTLFEGSVGRSDLPGGDTRTLLASLKIFKDMDDDITIYPGHGGPSKIDIEKRYNPYLSL